MGIDLFGPAVAAGGVTARPAETRLFGLLDTFFKDCSSPDIDDGTEFQAAWFNEILAVLRALARGNGQTGAAVDIITENNADDSILLKAIQHLIQRGIPSYVVDTGTPNQVTLALSPALAEYKDGFRVWCKINGTNTGATNCNINALGNRAVKTIDGANPPAGALVGSSFACLQYDGTNSWFRIISTLGAAAFSLPKAQITLAAIGALTNATNGIHGMAVASSNDMGAGPTISGGNAVVLPAGTYAYQIFDTVTCTLVNNNTQTAYKTFMLKNGSTQQQAMETTFLLAGQNATVYPGFSGVVQVNGTDTLQVASYVACTTGADFGGGNAAAGFVTFQRIGA